tara:strand:+ start:304 stop:612 length:309 start_codon:yes stop_codon:yes gene_type:complete
MILEKEYDTLIVPIYLHGVMEREEWETRVFPDCLYCFFMASWSAFFTLHFASIEGKDGRSAWNTGIFRDTQGRRWLEEQRGLLRSGTAIENGESKVTVQTTA